MAERTVVPEDFSPFVWGGYPPMSQIADDLKKVATVSDEQEAAIVRALEQESGFLGPSRLRAILEECVQNADTGGALARVVYNLQGSDIGPFLKAIERWQSRSKGEAISGEELERVRQRLNALVRPFSSLVRYKKAERIAAAVGQPLETLEVICELRPVFDDSREEIEGMIPCTRLKVSAEGDSGESRSLEVQLTARQIEDLIDKATKARKKLQQLEHFVDKALPGGLPGLPGSNIPESEDE